MKRPMIRIHNVESNEIIDREMNDAEFAQYQKDQQESLNAKLLQEQKEIQKAALLTKLGISVEEAKLLLS